MKRPIAYFISPHGYGHAARACAVMGALFAHDPEIKFEIFTSVPLWFFNDSLRCPFEYHQVVTDVGLVQLTPFAEDLEKSLELLRSFYPLPDSLVESLAREVKLSCRTVISDICPLGLAVAKKAGLSSVLIENFTWDWIYQGYCDKRFKPVIEYLSQLFSTPDFHIQVKPFCVPQQKSFVAQPVSRAPRSAAQEVRTFLSIPNEGKLVLVTLGGASNVRELPELKGLEEATYLLIPGAVSARLERRGNIILLPHHSELFHPDLVYASDAVVGKVGYSTLAEVYHAGVPFGYIPRPSFAESEVLVQFIEAEMNCIKCLETDLWTAKFTDLVSSLVELPRINRRVENGAAQIARFLFESGGILH